MSSAAPPFLLACTPHPEGLMCRHAPGPVKDAPATSPTLLTVKGGGLTSGLVQLQSDNGHCVAQESGDPGYFNSKYQCGIAKWQNFKIIPATKFE
jgi:hypothetical protein